jgi:hypothetical protein
VSAPSKEEVAGLVATARHWLSHPTAEMEPWVRLRFSVIARLADENERLRAENVLLRKQYTGTMDHCEEIMKLRAERAECLELLEKVETICISHTGKTNLDDLVDIVEAVGPMLAKLRGQL